MSRRLTERRNAAGGDAVWRVPCAAAGETSGALPVTASAAADAREHGIVCEEERWGACE